MPEDTDSDFGISAGKKPNRKLKYENLKILRRSICRRTHLKSLVISACLIIFNYGLRRRYCVTLTSTCDNCSLVSCLASFYHFDD